MKQKQIIKSAVLFVGMWTLLGSSVAGLSASFDASFSNDGYDIISSNEAAYDTALQSDGKLLVSGYNSTANGESGPAIRRYNINGSLDTTFAGNGLFAKKFSDLSGGGGAFEAIALQSDGKIIAVGHSYMDDGIGGSTKDSLIARINTDGSLDTSFSGDGFEITNSFGDGSGDKDGFYDVAVKSNGTIVAVGGDFVDGVARVYTNSGALDTAYDSDGIITSAGLAGGDRDFFYGVAIDSLDNIVVTGASRATAGISGRSDLIVVRYGATGQFDTTFNGVGYYTEDGAIGTANSRDSGTDIQIFNNKIYVVGSSWTSGIRMLVWSFNDNGSSNTNFNSVGRLFVPDDSYLATIRAYNDGFILLGSTYDLATNNMSLDLWSLSSNGTINNNFGVGGRTTFYPNYGFDEIWIDTRSLEVSGDKIYVAGSPFDNKDFSSDMWFVGRFTVGNTVKNKPAGTKLTTVSGQEITAPMSGSQSVVIASSSDIPIVEVTHDFSTEDFDFTGVVVDTDTATGRAVVSGLSGTHALYVPRLAPATQVIICPDANTLSDVYEGCPNQLTFSETDSNTTVETINGQEYWRVDGLTGTGGMNLLGVNSDELAQTGTTTLYEISIGILIIVMAYWLSQKRTYRL